APPLGAFGELFVAHGPGLCVALTAFRWFDLVKPGLLGGACLVKEQEVRRDLGVGSEDALGKADDGVQVALVHQLLLDLCSDALAEEGAVREDDGAAAVRLEFPDDLVKEQPGRLAGLVPLRESL